MEAAKKVINDLVLGYMALSGFGTKPEQRRSGWRGSEASARAGQTPHDERKKICLFHIIIQSRVLQPHPRMRT
jgi:hypothetical protein